MRLKFFNFDFPSAKAYRKSWEEQSENFSHRVDELERKITECQCGTNQNSKLVRYKNLKTQLQTRRSELENNSTFEDEQKVKEKDKMLSLLLNNIDAAKIKSTQLKETCDRLLDTYCRLEEEKSSLLREAKKKHNSYLALIKLYTDVIDCKIAHVTENTYELRFMNAKQDVRIKILKNENSVKVIDIRPKLSTDVIQFLQKTEDFQGFLSMLHFAFRQ